MKIRKAQNSIIVEFNNLLTDCLSHSLPPPKYIARLKVYPEAAGSFRFYDCREHVTKIQPRDFEEALNVTTAAVIRYPAEHRAFLIWRELLTHISNAGHHEMASRAAQGLVARVKDQPHQFKEDVQQLAATLATQKASERKPSTGTGKKNDVMNALTP